MHEAALAQAARPAPTAVLGLLLKPYSLGHELQLIREQNSVVSASVPEVVKIADLAEAVWICSQTFDECGRAHRDLLLGPKLWLWRRRIRNANFGRELKAFSDYRESGSLELPHSNTVRPDRRSGRMPGAPFLLRLYQFLVTHLGVSEAAAWDYPYGFAKMQWQTYWESEGGLDLYNAHEAEFDAYVAQQEALETAKIKEGKCPH